MIAKAVILSAILLSGCALAAQPGLFKQGSTTTGDGWKLTYSAVAKPPLSGGQQISLRTDASHTDIPGKPPVFHRFFADPATHTYFGYDVVVQAAKNGPAIVKFQPLSLRGAQLPKEYNAAEFRTAAIPQFPAETYQAGQTIAIDVLKNPKTGLRVVDYVQVSHEAPSSGAAANVAANLAKVIGNPGAPVRIELYSDFECPGCKAFHDMVLPLIVRDYVATGKAYLVSHEFPLTMHRYSREAANLATAAARIGKYQPVADALFHDQQSWAVSGNVWGAVASVLTPEEQTRVQALAKDPSVLAAVQQDVDLAMSLRVGQTPTIYLVRDQKRYAFPGPGMDNYGLFKSLMDGPLK